MPGYDVTRPQLDQEVGSNIVALRSSLDKSRTIKDWLDLHPSDAAEGDLLTMPVEDGGFGYSPDDAYALRLLYEGIVNLDTEGLSELGKKFTGLY